MLTAKILNSSASLNEFRYLNTVEFVPGGEVRFAFRLWDLQLNERHVPPTTAIVTLTFNDTDGNEIDKIATVINAGDISMMYVDLTSAETAILLGGNITFEVDVLGDATKIEKGLIQTALSKVLTEC